LGQCGNQGAGNKGLDGPAGKRQQDLLERATRKSHQSFGQQHHANQEKGQAPLKRGKEYQA